MKKIFLVGCLLLAILLVTSCSRVEAGYVGVKVNLLGSEKGVDTEVLGVGRYYIGINEKLYTFPTFQQNVVWTASKNEGSKTDDSFTFQTIEGLSVNADVALSYQVEATKVTDLFQKYRKGVDEITNVYLRNEVRNALNSAASTKNVEFIYGEGKAELIKEVNQIVSEKMEPTGIIIDSVSFIGSLRLPENVLESINSKVEATQRAQQRENELRETEAEVKKQIAAAEGEAQSLKITAEAQAEANRIINQSLTANLLELKSIEKWDGVLPKITGDTSAFVDVGSF